MDKHKMNRWIESKLKYSAPLSFPLVVLREHSFRPPPPSVPTVRFIRNNCTGNEHNFTFCAEFQQISMCGKNQYSAVLCSNPNGNC